MKIFIWRASAFILRNPNLCFLVEMYGDDLCMLLLAWFN